LLRLRGDFGTFVGHVQAITPEGLSGLAPDAARDAALPLPVQPIAWSNVHTIERFGPATSRGAWSGALVFGAIGATLAGAISAGLGNDSEDVAGAVAVGGVGLGAVGALLGGMGGSQVQSWHVVYDAGTAI